MSQDADSVSTLVATPFSYCIVHGSLTHDGLALRDCVFRQLFHFENGADEDALTWTDGPAHPDGSVPS